MPLLKNPIFVKTVGTSPLVGATIWWLFEFTSNYLKTKELSNLLVVPLSVLVLKAIYTFIRKGDVGVLKEAYIKSFLLLGILVLLFLLIFALEFLERRGIL